MVAAPRLTCGDLAAPCAGVSFMAAPADRGRGAWCVSARGQVGAIKWYDHASSAGVRRSAALAACRDGWGSRGVRLEAADVLVAQPIVDEGDDLARDRRLGDVATVAPLGESFPLITQPAVFAELLGGLDHCPPHQSRTLFW